MAKEKNADLFDLLTQLRMANRLSVAQLKDKLPQNQLIALLASTGASSQEIADTIGTTQGVVAVTMNRLKKKNTGKK